MESLDLILSEYKANEGYCTKQERSAWKSPSSEPKDSPWEGKSLKQDSIAEGWKLKPTSNRHLCWREPSLCLVCWLESEN